MLVVTHIAVSAAFPSQVHRPSPGQPCITTTLPADGRSSLFSILVLVPLVYINVTPESQTSSLFSRDYHQNPLRVHALRLHDWRLR